MKNKLFLIPIILFPTTVIATIVGATLAATGGTTPNWSYKITSSTTINYGLYKTWYSFNCEIPVDVRYGGTKYFYDYLLTKDSLEVDGSCGINKSEADTYELNYIYPDKEVENQFYFDYKIGDKETFKLNESSFYVESILK